MKYYNETSVNPLSNKRIVEKQNISVAPSLFRSWGLSLSQDESENVDRENPWD